MTAADAASLLELPPDASPEQIENRFLELRGKLEDRIAKAPTPGLKAKYRESLQRVTQAYETLELATDMAVLPVLQQPNRPTTALSAAGSGQPPSASPARVLTSPLMPDTPRSSRPKPAQKEFLIVVLLALALMGGGGWWVMKTRAEASERARSEAAAKAEADRVAAEAAARAAEEKTRFEARQAALQAQLAEAKITWEVFERELAAAERQLTELRSDLRAARDLAGPPLAELQARLSAQQAFVEWVQPHLLRHPAQGLTARLEALLAARVLDDAATVATQLTAALAALDAELTVQKRALLTLTAPLTIISTPSGLPYELRDSYGRIRAGTTPAHLEAPVGPSRVQIQRPGWPDQVHELLVQRGDPLQIAADFPTGILRVASDPPGLSFSVTNSSGFEHSGTTPAEIDEVPAGTVNVRLIRPGWAPFERQVAVAANATAEATGALLGGELELVTEPSGAEVWSGDRRLGTTPLRLSELPPGPLILQARLDGYFEKTVELLIEAGAKASPDAVVLQRKPTGLVRPESWRHPTRLTLHTTTSGVFQASTVAEYDFLQPQPNGEWGRIVLRYVTNWNSISTDPAVQIKPGTTLQMDRASDGRWMGQVIAGGFGDPQHNHLLITTFTVPVMANLGVLDVWPAGEVSVGEEWDIAANPYPLLASGAAGTARGRLLAIQRSDAEQWADLEISYDLQTGTGASAIRYVGVVRLRVDLKNHYVLSYEDNGSFSGATKGSYGHTTKVTVR